MSNFFFILGLILSLFLPIIVHMYFIDRNRSISEQKKISYLSVLPGFAMLFLSRCLQPSSELILSKECGVVKQYRSYLTKHSKSFERIAISMDQSGYIRYFLFDQNLPRLNSNQPICFDLYDRFKNKNLAESRIIRYYPNKI
ncbi:hypothetical protein IAE19_09190 [Acinetobacter sp. S40]|uniref:hypothetical protein n=1 Tax=Acinetobacter sp. S40 TaxID=2767434 RepID=UPI00190CF8BE|nr:hypothetical protein [Acinetobacter sp. S40]MBJ9985615.1 hypothetical protein [Acinetobacter sp. S40]